MNLKAYLANKNITLKEFAVKVGCHPHYLSMIGKGRHYPGKRLLSVLKEETEGLVDFIKKEAESDSVAS